MPSPNAKAGLRPFTPTRFGRYTLLAPLATGGMAQVFLARVTGVEGFEKLVVIKKILSHLAADTYFVDRFLDEGKIVVKLQHGSIAQVIDMGKEGDEYYIAMEFVDGKDLRKVAARCRDQKVLLPTGLALYIFVRLLDALAYAHRKKDDQDRDLNLVHRDVSPQNILVSYEGEVKIIDFGLAKSALSLARTSPSVILGKFFYMSPEQARHQAADRRSDLYATGICLWEILAGRNPFDDTPPGEILRVVASPNIPALKEVCPDVADSLNEVVMKALAPDPAQRFQTAEEMRSRLTAAMLEADPMAGPEALAAFMRERFEREYENERKMIAVLCKLPPPEEPAAPSPSKAAPKDDDDDGLEPPAPADATRKAPVPLKRPEPVFDNTANAARDVTNTDPTPAADGLITSPLAVGPVFGGAAKEKERRPGSAKQRSLSNPAVPVADEPQSDKRATVKFDPLEFVPGEAPAAAGGKREEKKAGRGTLAPMPAASDSSTTEPRAQRPASRSRPATKAPGEAARQAPAAEPAAPAPAAAPAEESIVVAPDASASLGEAAKVEVSPELAAPEASPEPPPDGPATPATPLGTPVFSTNVTSRGMDMSRGGNTLTIVLVLVGVLCIVAAAAIAVVVFKPSWLGLEESQPGHTTTEEPEAPAEPPAPQPPPKAEPPAPKPTAPSPPPPAEPAAPPKAAPPEPVADASVIEEPPAPPWPRKPSMKKAEMERWFDDLDARFEELKSKYPTERMLRLTSVHELMKKKRGLLATQAKGAELEVWLRWYEKSLVNTRRRLEK